MPKIWRIAPHDPERVSALERSAGIPAVVAQLLVVRGIDCPQAARDFLDAKLSGLREPELLPGAVEAAEILHRAIADKKRIIVYGDYDADGMTATAILLGCLKLLGANADYYVPNRIDEGYGLNHEALRSLALEGAQVVVTVDCGIASVAQAETASRVRTHADHYRSSPARSTTTARGSDRTSGPARQRVSVCRPVRSGRRAEARLGALPTGQRSETR